MLILPDINGVTREYFFLERNSKIDPALYECAKRSELIQLKTIAWCPNQLLV